MKIGVVLPTYNQARFLPAALESYFAQLYLGAELVVVDDASTDDTPKILAADRRITYRARHVSNRGAAEAINTGIDLLTTTNERLNQAAIMPDADALTWISSDNEMSPAWLRTLARAMEESGAGAVYGGFHWSHPSRGTRYLFKPYDSTRLIRDENCFFGPAFLIRRDVWLEAGPHHGKISHDYAHWLRVEEACAARGLPIVGVDKSLCLYNAHEERATVVRAREYDATHWKNEARKRRGIT